MSDQAEEAAKFRALKREKDAKAHLAALRSEMGEVGKQLEQLGRSIQRPENYKFLVTNGTIEIGDGQNTIARLSAADRERLGVLISDYIDSIAETARASGDASAAL